LTGLFRAIVSTSSSGSFAVSVGAAGGVSVVTDLVFALRFGSTFVAVAFFATAGDDVSAATASEESKKVVMKLATTVVVTFGIQLFLFDATMRQRVKFNYARA
jgi:hypothetical protein